MITWIVLSIIAAFTLAGVVLASEWYKLPTVPRLFWVRVMTLIVAGILSLHIAWPQDPVFYLCMFALALMIGICDILYYTSARDLGAGVTTRIEPLSVLLTFVAWTIITPSLWQSYMAQPLREMGIILCFAVAGYCALHLRHCAISMQVMKRLAPVIVMMAIVTMLAKTGMDRAGQPYDAAVAYMVLQAGILVIFYGVMALMMPARTGSLKPDRALIKGAAVMAFFSMLHISTKNAAYIFVANPAYVSIIVLAAPVLIVLFYKLTGRPDDTDIRAGLGIVAAAVALIILTRF